MPDAVFEIIAVGIGLAVTTIALVVPVAADVVFVPVEITAR